MSESIQVYTLALQVPPPNVTAAQYTNEYVFEYRTTTVCAMKNGLPLTGLTDEELKALLNDDSLPLSQQIRVLDERRHRAAVRRKAEEMAELVGTVPVMAALDDSAEMVRKAQTRLDRAKRERAKAVQAALAAGYSVRTVAEIAGVAPSTALRLGSNDFPAEPPSA